MIRKIGTALLAGLLLLAGSGITLSAEGGALTCAFSAIGVYETDSSVHELYDYDGSSSASLSLWKEDAGVIKVKVTASEPAHAELQAEALQKVNGSDTLSVTGGLLKETSATLGMGIDPHTPHVSVPDIMSHETGKDLAAGETAYFWVRVNSEHASSGTYRGLVHIIGDQSYDLELQVRVSPFTLKKDSTDVSLWLYPYSSYYRYASLQEEEPFSEAHQAVLRKELALAKEAGVSHITCAITDEPWAHQTYYDTPSLVSWNVDGGGYLWFDFSDFDTWVDLCQSEGIDGQIDCFSILPFDHALIVYSDMGEPMRYVLTPGDETWRWYWENFMTQFIGHLNEKGWLDQTCMYVDERGIDYFSMMLDFVESIEGGDRLKFGAAVNVIPRDTEIYDRFDELSISVDSVPENDFEFDAFLAHRNEAGLRTTMYNCSTNYPNAFAVSDPCESVWTMQYLDARGFDGYLRWAFNAWSEDPLVTADNPHFESGDAFLIYPDAVTAADPEPVSSFRLAMIEQGLNDIRKVHQLKEILNPDTRASLEAGLSSIQRCHGAFNAYGAISAASEENRRLLASESIRIEELIEKAAVLAAMESQKIASPLLKQEFIDLCAQYQP